MVKTVTFHAIVPTRQVGLAEEDILEAVARNAISVAKLVILHETVQKEVPVDTVEEDMVVAVVDMAEDTGEREGRRATLAEAMAICPGTAPKVKSATIVSFYQQRREYEPNECFQVAKLAT